METRGHATRNIGLSTKFTRLVCGFRRILRMRSPSNVDVSAWSLTSPASSTPVFSQSTKPVSHPSHLFFSHRRERQHSTTAVRQQRGWELTTASYYHRHGTPVSSALPLGRGRGGNIQAPILRRHSRAVSRVAAGSARARRGPRQLWPDGQAARGRGERRPGMEGLPRPDSVGCGGPWWKRTCCDSLAPSRVCSGRPRGVGLIAEVGASPVTGLRTRSSGTEASLGRSRRQLLRPRGQVVSSTYRGC